MPTKMKDEPMKTKGIRKSLVGWTSKDWKKCFRFDVNHKILGDGYLTAGGVTLTKFFADDVKCRITIEEIS